VQRYEAIDDLMGHRLHAGSCWATPSTGPHQILWRRQERLTAASAPSVLTRSSSTASTTSFSAAMVTRRSAITGVARGRVIVPISSKTASSSSSTGDDRYGRLEPAFDATIANLRFKVGGKPLAIEPTLNLLQDRSGPKRKAAAEALALTFKDNIQGFVLITNTLAKDKEISDRWRGFADIADDRHLSNRVEREVVDALVAAVRAAYPKLSHRYYALKARWFGKKKRRTGSQRAAAQRDPHRRMDRAPTWCPYSPMACFCKMVANASASFPTALVDAPVRPARRRARSPTRPCRRRTLRALNYQANRAMG
jgi:oligoendopeptidase F